MSIPQALCLYLSGPMRGQPNQNVELFEQRTALLRRRGFIVYNPHELSRDLRIERMGVERADDLGCLPFEDFLKKDYAYVLQSDMVVLLPGWEASVGAVKELRVALEVNIPAYTLDQVLRDFQPYGPTELPGVPQVALPESALQEAQRLVHGDRMDAYGHPIDDYTRTGRLWAAILDGWLRAQPGFTEIPSLPNLDPRIAALMMGAVKISREVNQPRRDNRVDLAGYAECAQMIAERQNFNIK